MTGTGALLAGRYELREPIGAGGMATVWRARDTRLERWVAVKLLRPQFADDPGFTERFAVEAQHAASLAHPNVATVFDTGVDDGRRFIVMELVDGPSVADILAARGALPPGQAVDVAAAAARALAAAHRRGLIHRDVKPANILVGRDGRVRLADFGIARALTTSRVTAPGTVLGSIPYLSPEQARGEEASGAGDVFSLGVVLYEMLTGVLPWPADAPAAMAAVRTSRPPVPLTVARPGLPRSLEAIVGRALELDPGIRYPSARAFAETLEAWARRNASSLAPEPDLADTARLVAATRPARADDDPLVAGLSDAAIMGAAFARPNPAVAAVEPAPAAAPPPIAPDPAAPEPVGPSTVAPQPTAAQPVAAQHVAAAAVSPPPAVEAARPPDRRRPRRRAAAPPPRDADDRRPLVVALAALAPVVLLGLLGVGNLLKGGPSGSVLEATGTPGTAVVEPSATANTLPSPRASAPADASPSPSPDSPTLAPTPAPTPESTPPPSPHVAVAPIAAPTPRPTPRPTAAPVATSTVSAPARAVAAFYAAAEAHNWDAAIALWSPSMQERYPPQQWLIDRFSRTTRIDITNLRTRSIDTRAGTATVAVSLVEYRTVEPSPRTFSGSWDLVLIDGRWLLDDPHF